ncbi:hypothetical protein [Microbispora sp. NPDC049125]|uniref:hypothetical protein n=1 Tax=Microbispora sp. NPDC049125 TaxID=3154929 RepID=UPI0034664F3F
MHETAPPQTLTTAALAAIMAKLSEAGLKAEYIEDSACGDRLDLILVDGRYTVNIQLADDFSEGLSGFDTGMRGVLDVSPDEWVYVVYTTRWAPLPDGAEDATLRAVVAGAAAAAGAARGVYEEATAKLEREATQEDALYGDPAAEG